MSEKMNALICPFRCASSDQIVFVWIPRKCASSGAQAMDLEPEAAGACTALEDRGRVRGGHTPSGEDRKGVLFDHATGVVVGETAVIGNNVSILHHVTLGGTGKAGGDRHPKIGDGVLIGANATILGNVKIWEGAMIGVACAD
ncbi:hypothetical protein EV1_026233 [Malus domestica]|uniref:serine acetyltransferase 5-like n=1 Tax=Malus sylvestris TaxID=3752 RepID=UPI0021ACF07D|nr:serine acetyltransferase 5-like [Malus sylvestris]